MLPVRRVGERKDTCNMNRPNCTKTLGLLFCPLPCILRPHFAPLDSCLSLYRLVMLYNSSIVSRSSRAMTFFSTFQCWVTIGRNLPTLSEVA